MKQQLNYLISMIFSSFSNVKLQRGTSLWEAQALDNPLEDQVWESQCLMKAKNDEQTNWQNITLQNLLDCCDLLYWMDSDGIRFHLPQWLLLDLGYYDKEIKQKHKNTTKPDIEYFLTSKIQENGTYETDFYSRYLEKITNEEAHCLSLYFEYKLINLEINKQTMFSNEKSIELLRKAHLIWKQLSQDREIK